MKHTRLLKALLPAATLILSANLQAAGEERIGTHILGDQDAAVGLFLAPWKEEMPAAEIQRPPGLHDQSLTIVDPLNFARANTYYTTGRAYRRERLQRNH